MRTVKQARADQTRVLFNWGYANYEQATPAQAGATLTNAKVLYGVVPEVAAGLAKPPGPRCPRAGSGSQDRDHA